MEEKNKFYTCKYDRAFKEVMLKEENKDILKCLLESILKVKIEEIEIKNQERNTGSLNVKRKHLDALLKTNIGEIEIEVNSSDKSFLHPRNMAYLCDIYSHHTLVGQNYTEKTLFIQINLSYGLKDNKANRCYKVMDEEGKNFVKNFIIYEFNMDYYMKFWYTKDKEKIEDNKYLIMLDLKPKDLLILSKGDKVVSKYMEDLERVNKEYKFKDYMSAEEDARKIRNSELLESYEDGVEEGFSIITNKLVERGIDRDLIEELTKDTKEQVRKEYKYKDYMSAEEDARKIRNSELLESYEDGVERGRVQGIEQGIEQGSLNKSKEIALSMLKENIAIEIISKCTNLSLEEINNLKEK